MLDDYQAPGASPSSVGISQFNITTKDLKKKSGKKTVHFLANPKSCPAAGWKFTQTNTYAGGPLVATSFAPCTG